MLTGFDTIQIGVKYIYEGKELSSMPASLNVYSKVEVQYETMPGWKEDISKCRSFEELPANCQAYVMRLQELIGTPIRWVGVGADRDDMIELQCRL